MFKNLFILPLLLVVVCSTAQAQSASHCTGPGLNELAKADLSLYSKRKLDAAFARGMSGAEAYAYSSDGDIKVISAAFKSDAGVAEMNFYLQSYDDYLMEYHIVQNSNFFGEPDSVVLTDERSFYHVCDGKLLAPAFGGIIDSDIFDNMKLVIDVILTEEGLR